MANITINLEHSHDRLLKDIVMSFHKKFKKKKKKNRDCELSGIKLKIIVANS